MVILLEVAELTRQHSQVGRGDAAHQANMKRADQEASTA